MKYRYLLFAAAGAVILGASACGSHTAGTNRATRNMHRVENAVNRRVDNTDFNAARDYERVYNTGNVDRRIDGRSLDNSDYTVRRNTTSTPVRVGNTFGYDNPQGGIGRAIVSDATVPVFLEEDEFALNRLERKALKRKIKEEKQQPAAPQVAPAEPAAAPVFDVDGDGYHDNVTVPIEPVHEPETIDTTPAVTDYTPNGGRIMK